MSATQPLCITLPDGQQRHYEAPQTLLDIAQSISPSLAKKTVAGYIDNRLCDASEQIQADATIRLVLSDDEEALDIIRHSCAHLLGHAVKQLFPEANMVIGPVIRDGFYYDIAYHRTFTPDDVTRIEQRMQQLIAQHYQVIKHMTPIKDAITLFQQRNEPYKVTLLQELDNVEQVGVYYHQDYVDFCRGPHVPNTRLLKHMKLTRVSGAYWRGDANNEQLQRIYGTAWASKADLEAHLLRLDEAEKRDHRRLGNELNLFHFHEDAPGSVFWHPRGWQLLQQLTHYLRQRQQQAGYQEINSPDVMDRRLWEVSGHWQNYHDHMFTTDTADGRSLALKPMNCPGGVLMYRHGLKSYRDLPIRLGEFGKVHRYEPSGSLHGLLRVRHFTQDDAHIFCTPEQLLVECTNVITLVLDVYRQFDFHEIRIKLSTRPDNRIGTDASWDILENNLTHALNQLGLPFDINPGEGAFYGPKLEFVLRDAIGRDWQCGTLQVDMSLPERFDIHFINEHGERQRPVMLHRAIFGSLERFIGILLEHHAGKLPAWLAPVNAVVLPISDPVHPYAQQLHRWLNEQGIRTEVDLRQEKIGYKIREHTLQRIPYLIVVGTHEHTNGCARLRDRDGNDLGELSLPELKHRLQHACQPPSNRQPQTMPEAISHV